MIISCYENIFVLFKAIAPVIKQMFSEWAGLVSTLKNIERRIEILQIHADLDLDQNKSVVAVSTVAELPNRHYYRDDYTDQVDGCCQTKQTFMDQKVVI